MQRNKLETLKIILTSEYWLFFSLSGVFFCFFAHSAGANTFAEASGVFLIIELLLGSYRIKKIPRWYLVFAAICAYLVLASVLNPYAYSKLRYIKRLARMVIIVFAIHCLSQKDVEHRILFLFSGLLAVSVCWQFTARYLYRMPFGTYSNPHFLASFAAMALPLIVYSFLVISGWYRFIFIPIAVLNIDLLLLLHPDWYQVFFVPADIWHGDHLLRVGSLPPLLAITCGIFFVVISFSKGWYKWFGLILIFFSCSVIFFTDFAGVATRLKNIGLETLYLSDRIEVWRDSWHMLKDNSLISWVAGNGIGSFRMSYPEYAGPVTKEYGYVFPHFYLFEILYENGIVGFFAVFGGLGFVFLSLMLKTRSIVNKRMSFLIKSILTVFVIWFINSNVIFPFYSNYTLIPLAFILGTMLVLLEKIPHDGALDQDSNG